MTSPLPSPSVVAHEEGSRSAFTLASLLPRRQRSNSLARPGSPSRDDGDAPSNSPLRRAFSSRNRAMSSPQSPGLGYQRGGLRGGRSSSSLPSTPIEEASNPLETGPLASTSTSNPVTASLRLTPHLDTTSRSLTFEPIQRTITLGTPLRVGRYNDRSDEANEAVTYKSKVVSRTHAEIWVEADGRLMIRDTKSSSGTFLNFIRLSGPGLESRPFVLKDGDVLQFGVDYQNGIEAMYRCVKCRVELNRSWQRGANAYNLNTFRQLRAITSPRGALSRSKSEAQAGVMTDQSPERTSTMPLASEDGATTCCICLFSVAVCQALFIAPCSHVYHYKCILMHHPGFSCPLCRTFADLDADVELEDAWQPEAEGNNDAMIDGVENRQSGDTRATAPARRPSAASSIRLRTLTAPDAGEFQSETRRASVTVSGPQGIAMSLPVTGRTSRPSSVRHLAIEPMSATTLRHPVSLDDGEGGGIGEDRPT